MIQDSNKTYIYAAVFIINLLLSLHAYYFQVINPDSFVYFEAANLFKQGAYTEMVQAYKWPAYPILIAITSLIFHTDLVVASLSLNAVFYLLIIFYFARLSTELFPKNNIFVISVLFLVLLPPLNKYRGDIIKDIPSYAFILMSTFYYIQYLSTSKKINLIYWGLSVLTAFLFRIEWVILFSIPVLYLLSTHLQERHDKVLSLKSILFLLIAAITLAIAAWATQSFFITKYVVAIIDEKLMSSSFVDMVAKNMRTTMIYMNNPVAIYTGATIAVALAFVFKLLKTFYWVNLIILGVAVAFLKSKTKDLIKTKYFSLIALHIVLSLLPSLFFYNSAFMISGRHLMPTCLYLFLFMPPILHFLLQRAQNPLPIKLLICALAIVFVADNIIPFKAKKLYFKDAGSWIHQNIPSSNSVLFDNEAVGYYAAHKKAVQLREIFVNKGPINQGFARGYNGHHFDYLVLTNKRSLQYNTTGFVVVKTFGKSKHNSLSVYKRVE